MNARILSTAGPVAQVAAVGGSPAKGVAIDSLGRSIVVRSAVAGLDVVAGDGLILTQAGISLSLEVIIIQRVASHCVGYSVGYPATLGLEAGMQVTLEKDPSWRRREPLLIATDKTIPSPLLTDRGGANA